MDIFLHFDTGYEAVFLINGGFSETADLRIDSAEVLYITVLPLRAVLLPYTIKLVGSRVTENRELCCTCRIAEDHYYIRLLERYNYVYSPAHPKTATEGNIIIQFFRSVKDKKLTDARTMLTDDLAGSIDNASLSGFFDDFTDIVENKNYVSAPPLSYFLIDKDGNGKLYNFEIRGGLIDNILEL